VPNLSYHSAKMTLVCTKERGPLDQVHLVEILHSQLPSLLSRRNQEQDVSVGTKISPRRMRKVM
jgi:hypothetical protein